MYKLKKNLCRDCSAPYHSFLNTFKSQKYMNIYSQSLTNQSETMSHQQETQQKAHQSTFPPKLNFLIIEILRHPVIFLECKN